MISNQKMKINNCLRRILLILCLVLVAVTAVKQKSKSVTTVLDAKWKQTPFIPEISEFLADEHLDYYWRYIDSIVDNSSLDLNKKTDKETYDYAIHVASHFLSTLKLSLLKFSLALKVYSPKVEMFHQIGVEKVPPDCNTFVEINNVITCVAEDIHKLIPNGQSRSKSFIYKLDHHYPGTENISVAAILHGEIGSESFRNFHVTLREYAVEGKIDYIIRHFCKERVNRKVRLSGYGVELAIKSSEYLAQDDTKVNTDQKSEDGIVEEDQEEVEGFIFSQLKELHPNKKLELDKLKSHLQEGTTKMTPLKQWQIQELSLQAAERIMAAPIDEALKVMRDISQNFPILSHALVKTTVREDMRIEIAKNQHMFMQHHNLNPQDSGLFINGIFFDMEVTDLFTILDTLKEELRVMEKLHDLGITGEQCKNVLTMDINSDKTEYAVDIRDSAIQYVNDIEEDRQYSNWQRSLTEILRPTYPGMLRTIRRNFYHLVFVLDPGTEIAKDLLRLAESFLVHMVPVRLGLVFTVNRDRKVNGLSDPGVAMLNAFNFISQDKESLRQGLSFLTDVYAFVEEKEITSDVVIKLFKEKYPGEDFSLVFGEDSDYDTGKKLAWEFADRTGLRTPPHVLINGVPLDSKNLNADMFEEAVLTEIMKYTGLIQKAVYHGKLQDYENVADFLMTQPNVMPRLNDRILSGKGRLLDMSAKSPIPLGSTDEFKLLSQNDMTAYVLTSMKYISYRDNIIFRPLTIWIVGDLDNLVSRNMLKNALEQVKMSNDIRIGVVFNQKESNVWSPMNSAVYAAIHHLSKSAAIHYLAKLLEKDAADTVINGEKSPWELTVKDVNGEQLRKSIEKTPKDLLSIHQHYSEKVLGIAPGQAGVVANGKILGPLAEEEAFSLDDFNLLERHTLNTYGEKLRNLFQNTSEENDNIGDLAMCVASLVLSRSNTKARHTVQFRSANYSVVKIPPRRLDLPEFDIIAITDPTSRWTQKLAPILLTLHEVLNCKIWLFLNGQEKLSEMPLKSFYRFVVEPEIQFQADESMLSGPVARFTGLPEEPLLTLNMHTPDNWLVEVMRSPYDLDNIRMKEVDSSVHGEFELEHLLLEGHCFEQMSGSPPRGLQFTMGTTSNPLIVDTIVMANLGYFQLKATPNAWILRLRQGRSSDIYEIVSHDNTDTPDGYPDIQVLISSFRSHIVKIKVNKKPDKMHVNLLDEDNEGGKQGIWNSLTSTFSGNKEAEDTDDKINIFSLASGHLYERFLRIMILSVVKHASIPVKFWFLKNYLSPTFKDFLPKLAEEYGFEYELVQYKWPRWLHQQTEKQRIIWGYKILFLDVLFPLDIKKIIYVDADQIARADLKELQDLDLGGAPYGYTPFCESRKEMDGFRFWKSGYWANHLAGRKYHISALYVVDLKKFRLVAAGDRLRGQYQGLSMDPNSLSNLDQDLPNNMIHQVAIKSLPQEWLWCETWCDNKAKDKAKTIDLCNNPQTKEPKLESAMRIIPEWKEYDSEIKKLQAELAGESFEEQSKDKSEEDKIPKIVEEKKKLDSHIKEELHSDKHQEL